MVKNAICGTKPQIKAHFGSTSTRRVAAERKKKTTTKSLKHILDMHMFFFSLFYQIIGRQESKMVI